MATPITVDIWSDVACPWCYIGKRRFEAGLAAFSAQAPDVDVEVTFHSFELMPEAAVDFDGTAAEFLAQVKGMSPQQVRQAHEHVTALAADVGLAYDFAAQQPTNTGRAHQLLHLAKAHGVQAEAKERLLRAHFVEGRHVGRDDELADIGAAAGLDRAEVLRTLEEGTYRDAVRADVDRARQLGISGVPFFVIDGRYGISGAQPPEVITSTLARAAADREADPAA